MNINEKTNKTEFIKKCGELLVLAKPNLISCEYKLGKDIELTSVEKSLKDMKKFGYMNDDEFVVVNCDNGYRYVLNVTGCSHGAIAETIFSKMACK
jgi:metal-dependent hydrolase (beta-lactamase superfamily II)